MGKLKYFVVSILIAAILAGIGVGIYMSWPAITGTINNSKYYTSDDIQASYDKGYNDGINNETELNAQNEYYRSLVDEYYSQILDFQNQNSELKKENQSLTDSVKTLSEIKTQNEQTISDLQETVNENANSISGLNDQISQKEQEISSLESEKQSLEQRVANLSIEISQKEQKLTVLEADLENNKSEIEKLKLEIEDYETQISVLNNTISNKEIEISGLNNQISNLSNLVSQLQATNTLNLKTIETLNSQVVALTSQISELKSQIENNSSSVSELEDKISKLQETVRYYENYIKNLENDSQVVVTFEFNDVVYNIQVVAKNSRVSVVNPSDTDYVKFNYWTVDGEKIDLGNYTFSENKKVVANCTFFQKVVFMNDSQVVKEEFVERGKTTTAPSVYKEGFEFDGWTLNGTNIVEVDSYQIERDVTFTAKYTQLFTVTFMFESETKSTQTVRSGEYASNVDIDSTAYKIFNYWTVDGVRVDVAKYKISANTVFVANITYKFDVKFMVDDEQYEQTQIVAENAYASVPNNPSKDKFVFDGWTINGQDVVNVATYPITQTTIFIAKFTRVYVVKFMFEQDLKDTQTVRHGSHASNVVVDSTVYKRFDGWTINGQDVVDVENYDLSDDITFIAKITYFFDVKFMVDGQQYDNVQFVEKGTCASLQFDEPTKDGFEFLGWTINGEDIVDVTKYEIFETTIFIAKFEQSLIFSRVFGENDWQTIAAVSELISSQNMNSSEVAEKFGWNIGDTISFQHSSSMLSTVHIKIIGFNHDDKSDGSGKAGISFAIFSDGYYDSRSFQMSTSDQSTTYEKSYLRSAVLPLYLRSLPSELQNVIKSVDKISVSSSGKVTCSDKLWILSEEEICGEAVNGYGGEGEIYEFFVTVHDGSTVDGRLYLSYSSEYFLTRSQSKKGSHYFVSVKHGNFVDVLANRTVVKSCCFCV